MKATDHFKQQISAQLELMGVIDPLFKQTLLKEGKTLDNCIIYILNTVQKSGCNGFTDEEVYSMAKHYYDEDNIEVGKPIDCKVVINHSVELTPEEIQEAKENAKTQIVNSEVNRMRVVKKPTPVKKTEFVQTSLFGL